MLQPEEIKNITFEQSVFSGYKKEDVDTFLDKLHEEYSRLYSENAELVEKLKVCITQIDEYRQDEKFLKAAIVNAQKLNESALQEITVKKNETEQAARKQADEIIFDAKKQAEQLMAECEQKIASVRAETTAQFSEQQKINAQRLEEQMNEYNAQIEAKKSELEYYKKTVGNFKELALDIYAKQIELLNTLPTYEASQAASEADDVLVAEETEQTVSEQVTTPAIEETKTALQPTDEQIQQPIEVVDDQPETLPVVDDQSTIEEPVVDEIVEEQISIDDMLTAKASPVEPQAPVVTPEPLDTLDDEEEDDFYLFGATPLIFPQDISTADHTTSTEHKGRRSKKKLKFGVDFDVKKDK